ncbi:hypothetical protein ACH4SK_31565 [Streptomyces inhibens]|uniref:hypothetical protein n=1 Tax=Streptomyces inhibens TaxID=2293571 RepID=UPI0037A46387
MRRDGPSSKRVQSWVAVAGLVLAAWGLIQSYASDDEGEKDEFSVLELSAVDSRSIATQKVTGATGKRYTSKDEATVLSLKLSNNTDDLKVFRSIKVETKRFIEVTNCVPGTGGDVEITAGYDIDLPAQGKSAHTTIFYQLQPRQAEGMSITLGPRMEEAGVYELEVFLQDGAGYQSMGTVTALSFPGLKDSYPLDLDTLPIDSFPDAACVRQLGRKLTDFISQRGSVPKEVRTLQKGVRTTAEELG